ncbi:helix-turn-helix transcriptional regulator [Brachyspira pilosicoli]|uniref:Transcriptional regulator n=1 Tax=Brachyspira pilosicoli TaxID=52584 RepID=A0A5C8EXN5_BRAPL|nr:helix-turn-helix transcriptional regulator [Brachyspira pilosicoli]TXJ42158.1 transcriptional regulator [Brachyspira pilosicoli]
MSSNIILETLVSVAHGIARQFGNNCEVCIHELKEEDLEHTILFIINGGVTGRKAGEGASNVVLKTIEKLKKGEPIVDHLSYLTKASNGKILKSSTVFIKDMEGKYRYILSINFDISSFIPFKNDLDLLIQTEDKSKLEEIPNSAQELMEKLILKSEKLIGKPASIMSKDEKIKAIKFLNDSGVFLITKSGDKVSNHFGISKFTLYNYIDSKKEEVNE